MYHPSAPPSQPYQHKDVPVPVPVAPPQNSYAMYQTSSRLTNWSTRLCHCTDDLGNCLITCICPCVTFGQNADIIDKGSCSCVLSGAVYGLLCTMGLGCLYSCFYRSKMRRQYDLEEGPLPDCLVHFCCEYCALCQEHRELKNRGFDMSIGFDGNVDRQSRGVVGSTVVGAPAVHGGMMR